MVDGHYDNIDISIKSEKEAELMGKENVALAKNMGVETGHYVAVVNKKDLKTLDVFIGDRVKITAGKKSIVCVVDATEWMVKEGEVGLSKEAADKLGIKKDHPIKVKVMPAPIPESVEAIVKKINGQSLTRKEIGSIIRDLMSNALTEAEISAFLVAVEINKLNMDETVALTNAMVNSGATLDLNQKYILDKHCIGGVAGNRTTMVLVPIIAAAGAYIPKTSSRAITSPAGTADTMEVLANVEFSMEELRKIVTKTHGAVVWGGGVNIAPADDKMIRIRRPLHLDPLGVMLASILGKKKAVGAKYLIIDIPMGRGAKVEDQNEANRLAKAFKETGTKLGMNTHVLITDGSEPIGNGIGPVLEARDVLSVLSGKGPIDLREKSLLLAGKLLETAGLAKEGKGYGVAKRILDSGKALKKMREIIEAQGGNPNIRIKDLQPGKFTADIKAEKKGRIEHIDNKNISRIARAAGAPSDKGAGIYLYRVRGDLVREGDKVLTIYAESEEKLSQALKVAKEFPPFLMEKLFIGEL